MHKFFRKQRLITNLFIAGILLLLNSFDAIAAGTCDHQGGTTTIGLEYTSDTCPVQGGNDNTTYHYIVNAIKCTSGQVALSAPYGDINATPSFLTENHYGTENTLWLLLDLAMGYFETGSGTLRINDISLEWGGLFDIDANWATPHKSHRTGKNVDVDDVTVEGSLVTEELLKKIIRDLKCNVTILSESNHFHLTFP
ncbi:MAG: hypothetical protein AB1610_10455 [Nitrospirota bacterium]